MPSPPSSSPTPAERPRSDGPQTAATPSTATAEPWPHGEPLETERLSTDAIPGLVDDWAAAAERAVDAGFEVLEVHAAHGYLLHAFLSPVTNTREDAYGGDFEGRTRLLREVVDAVPGSVPLFVRTSATDWLPDRESWTVDDSARLAADLGPLGVDLVDVSAGGVHPDQEGPDTGSHYQVPYAERVAESGVPAGAVGGIATPEGADAIVRNDRADLVVVGREHLRDPYFAIRAAQQLGHEAPVPQQYTRGFE